jgi:hypothetical protein
MVKMSSPLLDMDGMCCQTSSKPFVSVFDHKDTFEKNCVQPLDVWKTVFMTPDGNMVSNVAQIGDCNVLATHQSFMMHLFAPYIGK